MLKMRSAVHVMPLSRQSRLPPSRTPLIITGRVKEQALCECRPSVASLLEPLLYPFNHTTFHIDNSSLQILDRLNDFSENTFQIGKSFPDSLRCHHGRRESTTVSIAF